MKHLILLLIKTYQLTVSPFFGSCCRFYPSCSVYAAEAVTVHGALRGSWLTVRRLGRCHPWCVGYDDPVPPVKDKNKNNTHTKTEPYFSLQLAPEVKVKTKPSFKSQPSEQLHV